MSILEILINKFGNKIVLTKEEASEVIGHYPSTVQKMLEKRDTELSNIFYKAGKSWVCDIRDLAEFIEAGKHKFLNSSPLNTNGAPRVHRQIRVAHARI